MHAYRYCQERWVTTYWCYLFVWVLLVFLQGCAEWNINTADSSLLFLLVCCSLLSFNVIVIPVFAVVTMDPVWRFVNDRRSSCQVRACPVCILCLAHSVYSCRATVYTCSLWLCCVSRNGEKKDQGFPFFLLATHPYTEQESLACEVWERPLLV